MDADPQTSDYLIFECIPPEIVKRLDENLDFEDSCNFQQCSNYVDQILSNGWHSYDKLQVSEDPSECYIESTMRRVPRRSFLECNLQTVLRYCDRVKNVVIVVKEIGHVIDLLQKDPVKSIKEVSPYHIGGYIGAFFKIAPPQLWSQLESLSLHVDVMRESFSELWFPCPIQDLRYCIHNLVDAPFETFVQFSFCSASVGEKDFETRNFLVYGMELALKEMAEKGASTDFSIDVNEGYVDMTVEKGRVEYSFAIFYYNPHICEMPNTAAVEITDECMDASSQSLASFDDNALSGIQSFQLPERHPVVIVDGRHLQPWFYQTTM
ncbi:hypothetical protein AB6A40_007076 [Gnathostoma spinigerum]|uniref:Uncharacterized protein n=1 Tax=Gnathostoma spinigerum TaxID=75299 RepID=A0ABD6EMC9_9BILA